MAQSAYPKVGGATTDTQFREMMEAIVGTGTTTPGGYAATGDSSGMNVKVAAGFAFVSGIVSKSTAIETLTIGAAPGVGQSRIDTVVLQLDYSQNPIVRLVVIAGTAAATGSQAAPSLTPGGTVVYNWPIADVAVGPGVITITAANVTDRRTFVGSNVGVWSTATRAVAPTSRVFGYNTTTQVWEGWNGSAYVNVSTVSSALGLVLMNAASIQAAREALGFYVQSTAPANVAGRVWIKSA